MGTAFDRVAGLTMSLADRLTSPKILDEKLVGAEGDLLGLKAETLGLNTGASGLNDGGLEKLNPDEGNDLPVTPVGLNSGTSTADLSTSTSAAGLKTAAPGVKAGALGLNAGAVTLNPDPPSMLVLLLRGAGTSAGDLTAGAKLKPLEKDPGLNDAAGLNLNSLASTLSFDMEDFEVCLLWIADDGLLKANLLSFQELLTCDGALECCAELCAVLLVSPLSKLGFVPSDRFDLAPSLSPRGFC